MVKCTSCGAELKEGVRFCTTCGAAVMHTVAVEPETLAEAAVEPVVSQLAVSQVTTAGTKYELISTWGYIGISLLMCIPVVGQILMIVWACGGCRKLQKRNYARAMLIMFAISLVLSLIFGFAVRKMVNKTMEGMGIEVDSNNQEDVKTIDGSSGDMATEMEELNELLNSVEALSGGEFKAEDVVREIEKAQKEAENYSDGWPSSLPDYPDGQMTSVADYRTEISGTSEESFSAYIDKLKKNGFAYDDFYDFGMSEEDMLSFGGWWGTDGKLYLSISYYDGVVTVDHLTELPDYSSLLGE